MRARAWAGPGSRRWGRAWLRAGAAVAVPVAVLPAAGQARAAGLPGECQRAGTAVTCTYTATGAAQTFNPPAGISSIAVSLTGADGGAGGQIGQGAGGAGGLGAAVTGYIAVPSGQALTLYAGAQGHDGSLSANTGTGGFGYGTGGDGGGRGPDYPFASGGGGGGASAVVAGTTPLAVAAGGGGAGGSGFSYTYTGGNGGPSEGNGDNAAFPYPGAGGGGAAGSQPVPDGGDGEYAAGYGGGGGGGGGGLLGGGGGYDGGDLSLAAGGGGGGTNLVPAGGSVSDGVNAGDGQVVISYEEQEAAQVQVNKSGPDSFSAAGQELTYHYMIRNEGNVALTEVTVTDSKAGPVDCPGTLPLGATETCSVTYTSTSHDVQARQIANTAELTGQTPNGTEVKFPSNEVIVPLEEVPTPFTPVPHPHRVPVTG